MNKLCSLKLKEQQRLQLFQQINIIIFNNIAQEQFLEKTAQKEFQKIQMRKKIKHLKYWMMKYKKKIARMKKYRKILQHETIELNKFSFFSPSANLEMIEQKTFAIPLP
jgi:hypothetical protein